MNGGEHTSDEAARKRIETFIGTLDTPGFRPANDLTLPAFDKFLALNALLNELACGQGLVCQMTGSGSACFALAPDGHSLARARESILEAWGPAAFCQETRLLP
jgi:4-diphosphocytidyl-2C-methyl-D-erythritol kinase